MARAATTADAFNAVASLGAADLGRLAGGEPPVNGLVMLLGVTQPQVVQHLRVSRVGLVEVRDEGGNGCTAERAGPLKPIHDWVKSLRAVVNERFDVLDVGGELQKGKGMEAMTSSRGVLTLPTETQILITREFAVAKHLSFKAWTTPELIKRWWHANRGEANGSDVDFASAGRGAG